MAGCYHAASRTLFPFSCQFAELRSGALLLQVGLSICTAIPPPTRARRRSRLPVRCRSRRQMDRIGARWLFPNDPRGCCIADSTAQKKGHGRARGVFSARRKKDSCVQVPGSPASRSRGMHYFVDWGDCDGMLDLA